MVRSKIIYFTKYTEKGPSSRYRSYQYREYLNEEFELSFFPFFNDKYINNLYSNNNINYFQILNAYFIRLFFVLKYLWSNKIIFIEYELFPYFPPFFEYLLSKTKVKYVLDYDDAIFHNYDQHANRLIRLLFRNKISNIAKRANFIITGSPYLTNYFEKFNVNVIEIPTSILFKNYRLLCKSSSIDNIISVGWIGSKSTSINIIEIKDVIKRCNKYLPNIVFKLMGFDHNLKKELIQNNVCFYDWSESEELKFLESIDIGIMPLIDNPFNRGKCGFKLVQYMAMGKPTISTPLETNLKINRDNNNLFATNENEWFGCINDFINNVDFFNVVGRKNIAIVKQHYCVELNSVKYVKLFKQLINVRN